MHELEQSRIIEGMVIGGEWRGSGKGGDALGVLLSFQLIYQISLNLA